MPAVLRRDLKAENVLLHTNDQWVLCDFGSATNQQQVIIPLSGPSLWCCHKPRPRAREESHHTFFLSLLVCTCTLPSHTSKQLAVEP